jgi:hypothetical protein
VFRGADGMLMKWTALAPHDDGTFDLRDLSAADNCLAYGATTIVSPAAQAVDLDVWSDDGVMLWLNGARVHENDVVRALTLGPDRVRARLRPGSNTLLIKVANHDLGWGFRVGIRTGAPVQEPDLGAKP